MYEEDEDLDDFLLPPIDSDDDDLQAICFKYREASKEDDIPYEEEIRG